MSMFTEILAIAVGYGLKALGEKEETKRNRTYEEVVELIFKSDACAFDQRYFFKLLARDKSEAYYVAFSEIVKKDEFISIKLNLINDLNEKF